MLRVSHRAAGFALAACLPILACGAARRDADRALDPRFVAVHNALSAMGLVQIGPIQQGVLAQGGEAQVRLALPAGCVTIVAFGSEGFRDIDATLLDARGAPLAHDTTAEPQAVVHACVDLADTYTRIVHAPAGCGFCIAAPWAAGAPAPGAPDPPPARPPL